METSFASEATDVDITPLSAAWPVASFSAARIVARTTGIGAAWIAPGPRTGAAEPGGHRQAMAGQAPSEPFASSRQPALDRTDGASEVPRRLLVAAALHIAEDDRHPEAVGEPVDLRMNQGGELLAADLVPVRIPHRHRTPLRRPPAAGVDPGADRGAAGDPMEPGPQRVAHPERAGLPHQDQERRLEGVLGIVVVADDRAADPPDHRAVPLDQGRESRLRRIAAAGGEPLQQLSVRQSGRRPRVEEHAEGRGSGSIAP